jgi:amidase
MISNNDILNYDALTLSKMLANRQVTAVELMQATLDRIDAVNPQLNAIILLRDRTELLQEAQQCDDSSLLSSSHSPRKGWLHGIPMAIKDLSNVAGIPTTVGGSPFFEHYTPRRSDPFVQKLLDAGAIIIGKTNTPESGLGSHTFNARHGITRNPYDPHRSAGGSSGGAAVAVATRMLCIADGSDMMGSLRNPAGWNNLYSLRPTAGIVETVAVPAAVRIALEYPISTVGPMARTPQDLAWLLEIMVGDLQRFSNPFLKEEQHNANRPIRIAWLGNWNGAYEMEDGILEICQEALQRHFPSNKVTIQDKSGQTIFPAEDLWNSWTTIRSAFVSSLEIAIHGEKKLLHSPKTSQIRQELLWEIQRGMEITEQEMEHAVNIAKEWSFTIERILNDYDVIALPSAQVWPFPVEWPYPQQINNKIMDTYHRWMEVVVPVSLGGLPCVTIPAGFQEDSGLPMGIQLAGRRGSDAFLLELADLYHQSTDWPSKRPPKCC